VRDEVRAVRVTKSVFEQVLMVLPVGMAELALIWQKISITGWKEGAWFSGVFVARLQKISKNQAAVNFFRFKSFLSNQNAKYAFSTNNKSVFVFSTFRTNQNPVFDFSTLWASL
jgi:hypothetical protein